MLQQAKAEPAWQLVLNNAATQQATPLNGGSQPILPQEEQLKQAPKADVVHLKQEQANDLSNAAVTSATTAQLHSQETIPKAQHAGPIPATEQPNSLDAQGGIAQVVAACATQLEAFDRICGGTNKHKLMLLLRSIFQYEEVSLCL